MLQLQQIQIASQGTYLAEKVLDHFSTIFKLNVFMFLTNFGNVFSRSQCIINIRAASEGVSNETKVQSADAMLTIVDLAGAEREKRTGNQVILFFIFTFCIWSMGSLTDLFCKATNIYVIPESTCLISTTDTV